MAGGKSTAYQNNFLNWVLTGGAVTRPTAWTVALYTDAAGLNTAPTTEAKMVDDIKNSVNNWKTPDIQTTPFR